MTLISCIIPVYNGSAYIGAAVQSVLDQSMPIDQLIVVDDGSTDNTLDILAGFGSRLLCISKAHSGISDTLNTGLLAADGDFLTFLDADDLWHPEKTKEQYAHLARHPECDMVFCLVQEFVSPELPEEMRTGLAYREQPLRGLNKTSAMLRRECFARVGSFSTADDMGDFVEWYTRATEAGLNHHLLTRTLTMRRVHQHNFTRRQRTQITNYAHILKRAIDRRRSNT